MDLQTFVEAGYLLEANRRFFHPLGLSLQVYWDENDLDNKLGVEVGTPPKGLAIVDNRQDLVGNVFMSLAEPSDQVKHENVHQEWLMRAEIRLIELGWVIQPMGSKFE